MNINKHNYEAFFLDYHEGNLSPQQVADLLLFVEQHPELKEEFESFENCNIEDFSSYTFENKDSLKKEISINNKEEYFIRSVEGILTKTESELLNTFLIQHPQFAIEFELFQKTKLIAETNIFFKDKELLKRVPETADNLLISAVEGLLSIDENMFLQTQLSVDPHMRTELSLYEQTKLKADQSVVFTNKEDLKQKERKVIPFFYYVSGIAAAVLILFGLFFIFQNGNSEGKHLAKNIIHLNTNPLKHFPDTSNEDVISPPDQTAVVIGSGNNKIKNVSSSVINDALKNNPIINKNPENIVVISPNDEQKTPEQQVVPKINELPSNTNPIAIAKADKSAKQPSEEFLSLGQIAAAKIKQKTLSPEVIAMEKNTGRDKKFSGWDILQAVAKGVSKVTGKKVEAKPTYNDDGEVTAYALGAGGFQFSKGKKSN